MNVVETVAQTFDLLNTRSAELKALQDTHATLLVALDCNRKERDTLKAQLAIATGALDKICPADAHEGLLCSQCAIEALGAIKTEGLK